MKLNEAIQLQEGLSPVLFHATSIEKLNKIIETNQFNLTAQYTKRTEAGINEKMFFFSTARTRTGSYHLDDPQYKALIQLDGRKLSNNLSGGAVDYWGADFRKYSHDYEQEDRVFSDKPYIKNALAYIQRVDLLLSSRDPDDRRNKAAFNAYSSLKKLGIPVRVYMHNRDWIVGSTNIVDFETIKSLHSDSPATGNYTPPKRPNYTLQMVLKALRFNSVDVFDEREYKELIKHIRNFPMDKDRIIAADFHNATSDPRYRNLLYEISIEMRKKGIGSVKDLARWIFENWKDEIR